MNLVIGALHETQYCSWRNDVRELRENIRKNVWFVWWCNIYQNFGWAFSYNIIAIPMAAFGLLSPTVAAVAMSFSSITVVMNALRLKGMKLEQIEGGEPMAQTIFNVADMDCNHCVKTIQTALETKQITAVVDLASQTVSVDDAHSAQALAAITSAGYHPIKQTT